MKLKNQAKLFHTGPLIMVFLIKIISNRIFFCVCSLPGLVPVGPAGALPPFPFPFHRDPDVRHVYRQQNHVPVGRKGAAAPCVWRPHWQSAPLQRPSAQPAIVQLPEVFGPQGIWWVRRSKEPECWALRLTGCFHGCNALIINIIFLIVCHTFLAGSHLFIPSLLKNAFFKNASAISHNTCVFQPKRLSSGWWRSTTRPSTPTCWTWRSDRANMSRASFPNYSRMCSTQDQPITSK